VTYWQFRLCAKPSARLLLHYLKLSNLRPSKATKRKSNCAGRVTEDRGLPCCARYGTSLSQHELIDSYRDLAHRSVFVKLPLIDKPGEFILVWTATPWTLTANTSLAVHPDMEYNKVEEYGESLNVIAGALASLKPGYKVVDTVMGSDLVGLRYRGPFYDLPAQQGIETRVVA